MTECFKNDLNMPLYQFLLLRAMQEDFMGDEELQMMQQKFQINHPFLRCSSHFQITHLCINRKCNSSSLFCSDVGCPSCLKEHQICPKIEFRTITKLVQKLAEEQRLFVMRLYEQQDRVIKDLQKMRRIQIEKYHLRITQGVFGQFIQNIYFKEKVVPLEGKTSEILFESLKEAQLQINVKSKDLLKKFNKQLEDFVNSLNQLKTDTFKKLSNSTKKIQMKEQIKEIKKEEQSEEEMLKRAIQLSMAEAQKRNLKLDPLEKKSSYFKESTILKPFEVDKIQFILHNLLEPSEVKLIFRASQHGFRASAFHKFCNEIEFTFILYRTSFGKRMAGFTPYCWNSAVGWVEDENSMSFLISLDTMERMDLINPEKAIFCHENWGPSFGDDITVSDLCNSNFNSETSFPFSYGRKGKLQKSTEKTREDFCGGKKFQITQYEVYQVIW